MKRVEQYSVTEARDFFERLAAYSSEVARISLPAVHAHWPSTNCYEEWRDEHPIGHVLHYTAGVRYSGTIRHFVLGHRASSNWVIAKSLDSRFEELRRSLDLDRDIRAELMQIVPPTQPSWHAGWVNRFLAGTEVRNAGILRPVPKGRVVHPVEMSMDMFYTTQLEVDELDFYWWASGWTEEFHGEVARVETERGVTWWETWSRGSLATLIVLLRYLNSLYPGKLDPVWMLAHHNVNAQKSDVVLPVDLHAIRDAVLYSRDHVDDIGWLSELEDCEDGFIDVDDEWAMREADARQGDRGEEDLYDFDSSASAGGKSASWIERSLRSLGYRVESEEEVRRSVRIYQRSRDLTVDGVVGPQTKKALEGELRKWGIS